MMKTAVGRIYATEEEARKDLENYDNMTIIPDCREDGTPVYLIGTQYEYYRAVDAACEFLYKDSPSYEGEDPDDLMETYGYTWRFAQDVSDAIDKIMKERKAKATWKVCACGGEHDGECVAEFKNEALAINYCYDHEGDYPLGFTVWDPEGNEIENY